MLGLEGTEAGIINTRGTPGEREMNEALLEELKRSCNVGPGNELESVEVGMADDGCEGQPKCGRKHLTEMALTTLMDRRLLRPAYGVVIGMDTEMMMLVLAVADAAVAHVCDFSFEIEDTLMLENNRATCQALKTLPLAINHQLNVALLDIDIGGYKYLCFVVSHFGRQLEGIVVKIEPNALIIALTAEVYGKLRFSTTTENCGAEIGMKIDVEIVDFDPSTNDINLDISEDEETRTCLVEAEANN
ncbi:MAG: hypothetical protein ACKER6_00010 [Candidatus Hodgkinia cicadicola]